jgi:catechol 2,3-dioxygenase-like lactoylglutathione lyase family enzyme
MAKVTGIGGVFFRSDDPAGLRAWYESRLGITPGAHGFIDFPWRRADDPDAFGKTVWHLFPRDTSYFGPSGQTFMINYIVDDLDGLLESLRASGAEVDPKREDTDYGRFAWVTDPDGNRVELWEPPAAQPPAA